MTPEREPGLPAAVRWGPVVWLGLSLACGRTAVTRFTPELNAGCHLQLEQDSIDFGQVLAGPAYDKSVRVENAGPGTCHLTRIGIPEGSALGFARPPGATTAVTLAAGDGFLLVVRFEAATATAPLDRKGALAFLSDDAAHGLVKVPLLAHLPRCELSATPAQLHFGPLRPGGLDEEVVTLTNLGGAGCVVGALRLGGDGAFSLAQLPTLPLALAPGDHRALTVRFTAPSTVPLKREGSLNATLEGETGPAATVALEGEVLLCVVSATPNPFDFGNVLLNTTATHPLTLADTGSDTCLLRGFSLSGDHTFSLPGAPGTISLTPGASQTVDLRFSAFDSAPPHLRTGALHFSSNDLAQPSVEVPLSAFINTICTQAGQYIYTVDRANVFSRFDPASLTTTRIGTLGCPTSSLPFSMNLDQNAVAWVVFDDGRLFTVDTATARCDATTYVPGQHGMLVFGMGSVFDVGTGADTLYLASGPPFQAGPSLLGTLNLSTLATTVVGQLSLDGAELAGTGDGQLWAFAPRSGSTPPLLVRLDPATAATVERHDLSAITSVGGYAIKFWGGAFYVFIGSDVWKVPRTTLVPTQSLPTSPPTLVLSTPGLDVVGAGVSTCAPVLGP